jgi:catechol 2,3-dioxygenase-like lactoylglutathione lyase family enzyme
LLRNPDHVTIAVADAATAIEFFELLGFRKVHVTTIDGGRPARYMGMPDMKAQHITLVLEGNEPRFEIQLLAFDPAPAEDPGEHPTNLRRRGYNHLAFRVDDIEAVTAHLVAHGVKMLGDEMDYISRRLRFFEGPEKITLELVQWVEPDEPYPRRWPPRVSPPLDRPTGSRPTRW